MRRPRLAGIAVRTHLDAALISLLARHIAQAMLVGDDAEAHSVVREGERDEPKDC